MLHGPLGFPEVYRLGTLPGMRCVLAIFVLLSLALHSGCGGEEQNLEDRFFECRDLISDKEDVKASLGCFTKASRAVLSALIDQRKQTAGYLNYMRNYGKLLDYEDVLAPPDVRDNIALLLVGKKREQETIYFIMEDDEWVIDGFELSGFWAPLDNKEGQ